MALTEETHRNYLDWAIRGHSENISHASRENADASCLTSSFLRVCAFAALQERSLNPYTPPTQWLRMTHGTGRIFHATWHRMSEDETSIAMRVLNRPPILTPFNEALWAEDDRQDLEQLLQRSREDVANELWNSSIQEAYNSTLSYVSAINIAIAAEEGPGNTCRELIAFLMLIPKDSLIWSRSSNRERWSCLLITLSLLQCSGIWFGGSVMQEDERFEEFRPFNPQCGRT